MWTRIDQCDQCTSLCRQLDSPDLGPGGHLPYQSAHFECAITSGDRIRPTRFGANRRCEDVEPCGLGGAPFDLRRQLRGRDLQRTRNL